MYIAELFEETGKHASFCFGRMNPPTIGHRHLIDTVAKSARGGDYYIFLSSSQDPKKNPLDPLTKLQFLNAMFPEHSGHIIDPTGITTALHAASLLYKKGYTSITFVAGSDRLSQFEKLLNDYNGVDGKAHGYYKFDRIKFVSSGDRDPDADGLAGVSASVAREAAKTGDKQAFAAATGAGKFADDLFTAVRAGMNLNEEAAGVGQIATKAQARDPRYMMSLTKDVRPGETDRQLRKMRLKEKWSEKYKKSINCSNPKGFSQRAHCAGRKKHGRS
jgi:hypothetical protein